ncbi:MAG: ATP-binding protein [Leptospirillia bacterium]
MANAYGSRYAAIGLVEGPAGRHIQLKAFWTGEELTANSEYELAGTPCQDVLGHRQVFVPSGAVEAYPNDPCLADMGVTSYFGSPLVSTSGEVIGLVWVMDTKPMEKSPWNERLLASFARRIATELERQQAVQDLEQSQTAHTKAQHIAHLGHWHWNVTTGALSWSDEIYRIFGREPQAFHPTYEAFLGTVHPDDRQYVIDQVNAAVDPTLKRPYAIDHRIVFPSGEVRTVHEQGEVAFDPESGAALHMIGTVHDITKRREMEKHLQQAHDKLQQRVKERTRELTEANIALEEEVARHRKTGASLTLFRNLINCSSDSVAVIHADSGRFLDVNDSACDSLGYTRTHLLGLGVPDMDVSIPDHTAWQAMVEKLKQQGPLVITSRYRRRDGSLFDVEVAARYTSRDTGHYVVAVARDVTARKKAETDLKRAREEVEAANRAKSEFLSRMSHELRTPMNAVLGFAQVLEAAPDNWPSKERKECVGEILNAGNHLMDLINEVLNLSHIDSGRMRLTPEAVPVGPAMEQAVTMHAALAKHHGVTLENRIEPDSTLCVRADPGRLTEILSNLISNGIKYNRPGGTVILEASAGQDRMVRFTVTDNGTGISSDMREHLFEPFNRLGAEHSQVEGTGIGLIITRRLVELMGGRVGLDGRVKKGCRFHFTLPATAAGGRRTGVKGKKSHPSQSPAMYATGAAFAEDGATPSTVLYIEDNPQNLNLVRKVLTRRQNIVFETSTTGQEGLKAARRLTPDLILLDINLPDMDGFTLFGQLRTHSDTLHIPVIAVSADGFPGTVDRALASGFSGYVTKPIDIPRFLSAVDRALTLGGGKQMTA